MLTVNQTIKALKGLAAEQERTILDLRAQKAILEAKLKQARRAKGKNRG
jgi:hypothetical protein